MRIVRLTMRILFLICLVMVNSCGQVPELFAGSKTSGYQDGVGQNARFGAVGGMDIDKDGNIYVADRGNNRIRKITPEGLVSTFAGSGEKASKDGDLKTASFDLITDLKFDSNGNLFVADKDKIRKIATDGKVSTILSELGNTFSMAFDKDDNLYFHGSNSISYLTPSEKLEVFDLEKHIPANEYYGALTQIEVDNEKNIYLLIRNLSENTSYKIHKIARNGERTFFPDYNSDKNLPWVYPSLIHLDEDGNLYVYDKQQKRIFRINKNGNLINEVAGVTSLLPLKTIVNTDEIYSMVIDNNRKILYLSDFSGIYKINL